MHKLLSLEAWDGIDDTREATSGTAGKGRVRDGRAGPFTLRRGREGCESPGRSTGAPTRAHLGATWPRGCTTPGSSPCPLHPGATGEAASRWSCVDAENTGQCGCSPGKAASPALSSLSRCRLRGTPPETNTRSQVEIRNRTANSGREKKSQISKSIQTVQKMIFFKNNGRHPPFCFLLHNFAACSLASPPDDQDFVMPFSRESTEFKYHSFYGPAPAQPSEHRTCALSSCKHEDSGKFCFLRLSSKKNKRGMAPLSLGRVLTVRRPGDEMCVHRPDEHPALASRVCSTGRTPRSGQQGGALETRAPLSPASPTPSRDQPGGDPRASLQPR